jgi:hypothetical protein
MKFPQLHLFVDIHCPALISGQLSSWMKPAQLIAMIRPQNQQLSPPGAEAARHIRRWRSRHTAKPQEVQVIIAGDPWPSLYKGLGTHLKDSIRFENAQSMVCADLYVQLLEHASEFKQATRSADASYESFLETLELVEPQLLDNAADLAHEFDALVSPAKPSWMFSTLDELAQRFSDGSTASTSPTKKAA